MKKIISLILIIGATVFLVSNVVAQDSTSVGPIKKQKKQLPNQLYFGGTFGLSIGSYTMVGLYPLVGYKVTPKLSAGLKLTYQYVSDSRYASTYTSSNYGGSVFSRYRLLPKIYTHIEYETINYDFYDSSRGWVPFLYVGGGYSQRMGGKTWLNFQVLFDVLQDSQSPYSDWDPFFSLGVGVGF